MLIYRMRIDRFQVSVSAGTTEPNSRIVRTRRFLPRISAGKPPFFRQVDAFRGCSALSNMLVFSYLRIQLTGEWETAPDKGICQVFADV